MTFPCRLEGGPFDGDRGHFEKQGSLPQSIFAWLCPDCGDIHWSSKHVNGSERYGYERIDDGCGLPEAVYIFADLDLGGSSRSVERELVPA